MSINILVTFKNKILFLKADRELIKMGFYLHPAPVVAEIKNSSRSVGGGLSVSTKYQLTGTDCVGRAGQWQS